jgi:hypothetical protein
MYHYLNPRVDSFSLFKKKKPYDIQWGEFPAPAPPAPMIPVPNEPFDQPQKEKGLDYEAMMEALAEHKSAGPASFKSLGKPGGTGGGGFKLFPNSMVENMAPIGPLDEAEQRKRWWEAYARSIA